MTTPVLGPSGGGSTGSGSGGSGSGSGGSSGRGGPSCTDGDLGCDCYPNSTCNGDLVCVAGQCAMGSGAGAGGAPPGAGNGAGSGGTGGNVAPPVGGATSEPLGPVFLTMSTNLTTLNWPDMLSVTFSAVLTDPDGIDDLIGGTLKDPDSGSSYGAFATEAGEGAYGLTLTWQQINMSHAITGDGGVSRVFRAEFFDVAGHAATQDVTLMFECYEGDRDICEGECTDFDTEPGDCGSCGRQCESKTIYSAECRGGKCVSPEELGREDTTCAEYCATLQLNCDTSVWYFQDALPNDCTAEPVMGCMLNPTLGGLPTNCQFSSWYCDCIEP